MSEPVTTQRTKDVILAYWTSWQDQDWDRMRSSLADDLVFGDQSMKREQFIQFCQQGNPWDDVELIDSIFTAEGGALVYEGTDRGSKERIRVAEIVRVDAGRVCRATACFGRGTPPS